MAQVIDHYMKRAHELQAALKTIYKQSEWLFQHEIDLLPGLPHRTLLEHQKHVKEIGDSILNHIKVHDEEYQVLFTEYEKQMKAKQEHETKRQRDLREAQLKRERETSERIKREDDEMRARQAYEKKVKEENERQQNIYRNEDFEKRQKQHGTRPYAPSFGAEEYLRRKAEEAKKNVRQPSSRAPPPPPPPSYSYRHRSPPQRQRSPPRAYSKPKTPRAKTPRAKTPQRQENSTQSHYNLRSVTKEKILTLESYKETSCKNKNDCDCYYNYLIDTAKKLEIETKAVSKDVQSVKHLYRQIALKVHPDRFSEDKLYTPDESIMFRDIAGAQERFIHSCK